MKERPILFNADMVKAIIEGRKTQTRRVVKPQPKNAQEYISRGIFIQSDGNVQQQLKCPYGKVGDRLWVRESFNVIRYFESCDGNCTNESQSFCECGPSQAVIEYNYGGIRTVDLESPCDGFNDEDQAKRAFKRKGKTPSIHMPRWASSILLEITDVRIEHLQDISEEDCLQEGIQKCTKDGDLFKFGLDNSPWSDWNYTATDAFQRLWNSINKNWDENPWVWVVEFKVLEIR